MQQVLRRSHTKTSVAGWKPGPQESAQAAGAIAAIWARRARASPPKYPESRGRGERQGREGRTLLPFPLPSLVPVPSPSCRTPGVCTKSSSVDGAHTSSLGGETCLSHCDSPSHSTPGALREMDRPRYTRVGARDWAWGWAAGWSSSASLPGSGLVQVRSCPPPPGPEPSDRLARRVPANHGSRPAPCCPSQDGRTEIHKNQGALGVIHLPTGAGASEHLFPVCPHPSPVRRWTRLGAPCREGRVEPGWKRRVVAPDYH